MDNWSTLLRDIRSVLPLEWRLHCLFIKDTLILPQTNGWNKAITWQNFCSMLCRIQTKSSQCSLLDSINSREPSICTSSMKTPQKVEYYSLNNEINTKKPKHRCTTKKKKIFWWHLLTVELCLQEMVRDSSWDIWNSPVFKSTKLLNISKGLCLHWSLHTMKTMGFSTSNPMIFMTMYKIWRRLMQN